MHRTCMVGVAVVLHCGVCSMYSGSAIEKRAVNHTYEIISHNYHTPGQTSLTGLEFDMSVVGDFKIFHCLSCHV